MLYNEQHNQSFAYIIMEGKKYWITEIVRYTFGNVEFKVRGFSSTMGAPKDQVMLVG